MTRRLRTSESGNVPVVLVELASYFGEVAIVIEGPFQKYIWLGDDRRKIKEVMCKYAGASAVGFC